MGSFVLEAIKKIILHHTCIHVMEYAKKGFSSSVSKVQHTESAFLVDTTLLNLWIFNKNRESALYEVLLG